MKLLKS